MNQQQLTHDIGIAQGKADALHQRIKQLSDAICNTPTHCVDTKLELADLMQAAKRQRDMQLLLITNLKEIRHD